MISHTIDATNKKLGRVASNAAVLLRGKDTPAFRKNKVPDVRVRIVNASKMQLGEKKAKKKRYRRYSGYPGGLKEETMKKVLTEKGWDRVVRRAVWGMLPKNKLRSAIIQKLTISE
jgi:large subunit ribosomal protein L13